MGAVVAPVVPGRGFEPRMATPGAFHTGVVHFFLDRSPVARYQVIAGRYMFQAAVLGDSGAASMPDVLATAWCYGFSCQVYGLTLAVPESDSRLAGLRWGACP